MRQPGCDRNQVDAAPASLAADLRCRPRRNADRRTIHLPLQVLGAQHRVHLGLAPQTEPCHDLPSLPKIQQQRTQKKLEGNLPKITRLLGAPRELRDSGKWRDMGVFSEPALQRAIARVAVGGSFMPGPAKMCSGRV
jgi:hypothetical protein